MTNRKKYTVLLITVALFSIALTFFPLTGVLGYEYAAVSAFLLSFICMFISVEITNSTCYGLSSSANQNELLTKPLLVNFPLLLINFLIGLISSFYKKDCDIGSGIAFYLLIPLVTCIFSTSIGVLSGRLFKRRGFIAGSLILLSLIIYSLWTLYGQVHIFFYNAVIGYFPGSLYDKSIPITSSLVIYRAAVLLWAFLVFTLVLMINELNKRKLNLFLTLTSIFIMGLLTFTYFKQEDLGLKYSREYIKQNLLSETYETDHFLIHYAPGSKAAKHIKLIADDHEWRYREVSSYLEVDLNYKVRSYLYPDKGSRKKYIGSFGAAFANPIHKEIHQVYTSFPIKSLRHELVHVISSELGADLTKISPQMGLTEGMAVAVDWPVNGADMHRSAKFLISDKKLSKKLKSFLDIRFWYYPQSVSYALMGSYCRYLIDLSGIENFKKYYQTGDPEVYGKSTDQLIASWIEFLHNDIKFTEGERKLLEDRFSGKSVSQNVCLRKTDELFAKGIKEYKNGDFQGASIRFKQVHDLSGDSDALVFLAYSYYYNKDYKNLLDLDTKKGLTEVDSNIILNLKLNTLWTEKDFDRLTYSHFKKLVNLPIPDNVRREIDLKLDLVRFNKDLRRSFINYLTTRNSFDRFVIMKEINKDHSSYYPAYYLLGRMYFERGDYKRALDNLKVANSSSSKLPSLRVQLDNLKMLGISYYSLGDYQGTIRTFESIIDISPDQRYEQYARDFIERARWKVNDQPEQELK